MGLNVSSLSRNGLRDWLVQRVSAIVILAYTLFMVGYFNFNKPMNYFRWKQLFANDAMKVTTSLVLLSVLYHTYIGIWTVLTDYVKWVWLRVLLETVVALALFTAFFIGLDIFWSV